MIDKLQTIRYTLRDTEKYLVGVIKYDWMKTHPHFEYNQKQVLADIIKVLVDKQKELGKLINELKGSKQ
jgi:hypothetical protein|tara:strand:+ start:241 stop:447 length:207 start_codon:yes stop_codon:yes gene_type:complete